MSGSKPIPNQFDEEFLALEREEKRQRMLEQAVAMRPQRERTLAAMIDQPKGDQRGRTTF